MSVIGEGGEQRDGERGDGVIHGSYPMSGYKSLMAS